MSSGGRRKKAPAGYKPQKQKEVIDQDDAWLQEQQGALGDGNAPAKQPGEKKPRKKRIRRCRSVDTCGEYGPRRR
jgi:hypothetical protein